MRYYFNSEIEPTTLKTALQKVKGVESVEMLTTSHRAKIAWTGTCKELPQLEAAAAAAGVPAMVVSHVHLYLVFKALQGADVTSLNKELASVRGVKGGTATAASGEMHADLEEFTMQDLRGASEKAHFEVQVKSHLWIDAEVKDGDISKLETQFEVTKGVLSIRSGVSSIGFWASRGVTDAMLTKAALACGATLGKITR